jgi:hypothetical protein
MSLIVIISYQDNLLQFEFDENANVGDLKRKIEERTGVKPNRQHIIWNTGADEDITDDVWLIQFLFPRSLLDSAGCNGY